ncbi:MAG: hypothetical protein R2880_02540 [Deinococcales bacterium]
MLALFSMLLSACTLTLPNRSYETASPESQEAERLAWIVWHKMELGYLSEGRYDSNVLADIRVGPGLKIEVKDYQNAYFEVMVSHESLSQVAWFVSPEGIEVRSP